MVFVFFIVFDQAILTSALRVVSYILLFAAKTGLIVSWEVNNLQKDSCRACEFLLVIWGLIYSVWLPTDHGQLSHVGNIEYA